MRPRHQKGNLDSPAQFLPGVGPQRAALFKTLGVNTVRGVLFYFPRRYIDARSVTRISDIDIGARTTLVGKVLSKDTRRSRRGQKVSSLLISDG